MEYIKKFLDKYSYRLHGKGLKRIICQLIISTKLYIVRLASKNTKRNDWTTRLEGYSTQISPSWRLGAYRLDIHMSIFVYVHIFASKSAVLANTNNILDV